jgi:hypothetical protein
MWISNLSVQHLMESSKAIKEAFEDKAQQELEHMNTVIDNIRKVMTSNEVNKRGTVMGAFTIPNCVMHNNLEVVNLETAQQILENVELIDVEVVVVTATFKTLRVDGKNSKGKDNYVYQQETTTDLSDRWIINPHCNYKLYFDLIIVLMVFTSSVTVPYRMGFGITPTFEWSVFDGITEVFFCVDLVLAFFTAYELKDATLNTIPKQICSRYLRSWFLIDFLSAVPFYRMASGQSSVGVLVRLLKTLKLGRLVRLFKMFKFARILKLLQVSNQEYLPNEFIAIENSFGDVLSLLFYLGFTTHILACVFSWISLNNHGPSWASEAEDVDSTFERYIAALYWTYATMATVGK